MWGTSWPQRARLLPMFAALSIADLAARAWPAGASARPTPWPPGVTIVIPERDAPELLAAALASLHAALEHVTEPHQVVVVVNGAARAGYAPLEQRYPDVEWVHSNEPLGFGGAVERGVARARFDATFLLNNDMRVEPEALSALLALRAPDVFAIGAQIFQRSGSGRREETGFVDWYLDRAGVQLYHAAVPDDDVPREHLCASGGAAVYRTQVLRRYLRASRCYDPFYWEDAEWGVRAWRDGLRTLFCPAAHAHHLHRATTARFYAPAELARIVERNRWLFDARHGATREDVAWLMDRACELPYASQRDIARLPQALGVLRQRLHARRAPQPRTPPSLVGTGAPIASHSYAYQLRARVPTRRCVVLASPFAVYPPRHGGARRVAALARALSADFDLVLVSDEASLYDARSFAEFGPLHAVHLVERPADDRRTAPTTLPDRMRSHAHAALARAVAGAVARYRPAIVQVEYAELAQLVRDRDTDARWVLGLHDAYGAADFADPADAAAFAATLRAYDAVTVCSEEDARLIVHPRVACVPNGSALPAAPYAPSTSTQLLFVGPFRYGPNREGIVRFLREAWPAVRTAVPDATLLVLGGDEHARAVADEPAFAQPGVTVLGHRDDVPALLAQSALAINPLAAIRGSAVKLVEALAAGRVCVSTADGARGFRAEAPPGLVIVDDVAAMASPIVTLLTQPADRHRREDPRAFAWDRFSWKHSAARQRALYDELLSTTPG